MNYNIANKTFDGIPKLAFIGGQRWETVDVGSFERSCIVTDSELVELMVDKHGEKCRKLAIGALEWLNENEHKWKLKRPIGRRGFLNKLISKAIFNE
jgi:hypothetical protein